MVYDDRLTTVLLASLITTMIVLCIVSSFIVYRNKNSSKLFWLVPVIQSIETVIMIIWICSKYLKLYIQDWQRIVISFIVIFIVSVLFNSKKINDKLKPEHKNIVINALISGLVSCFSFAQGDFLNFLWGGLSAVVITFITDWFVGFLLRNAKELD